MFSPTKTLVSQPVGSMYGIFIDIYHKHQPNVGVYTVHGSYGQQCAGHEMGEFQMS